MPHTTGPRRARALIRRAVSATLGSSLTVSMAAAVVAGTVAFTAGETSAQAVTRYEAASGAAAYARSHGYKIGIAVLDTHTGVLTSSGYHTSTFASESVVKVMIATRLILQGRMHGTTSSRAYKMITQSDDAIASSFYGSVGGDGLITWIKNYYHVPSLGSPPHRANWWGNTHITADGLVRFYDKLEHDKRVWPWLRYAMHRAHHYGSDGTYQYFGIPSATTGAGIKQGWGIDYDDWGNSADFNSTGFVNGDRYAVALLARGPASTYGSGIGQMLTTVARMLMPGGRFPDPAPTLTSQSRYSGPLSGGWTMWLHGHDFIGVTGVYFGATRVTKLLVYSSGSIYLTVPPHVAGVANITVRTTHGHSPIGQRRFNYVSAPTVTHMTPAQSATAGGGTVTITGTDFYHVWSVYFSGHRATNVQVLSPTSIRVTVPPAPAGLVGVRVHTWYGWSRFVLADHFTYQGAPAVSSTAPATASSAGGTELTLSGHNFTSTSVVTLDGRSAPATWVDASTMHVTLPAHDAGTASLLVRSAWGTSAPVSVTYAGTGGTGGAGTSSPPSTSSTPGGAGERTSGPTR